MSTAKAGGIAALVQALCYVFGFAMLATLMNPGDVGDWSQQQKLEFVLDRAIWFQLWNLVIYVVFGIALVVLSVVLHHGLARPGGLVMPVTTAFGLIWAGLVIASGMIANVGLATVADVFVRDPEEAATLWSSIGAIQNGLGGGVEVVGGLWVLLLSATAWRQGQRLPTWLNALGVIVGLAGLATALPGLAALGAVFGLTQIVWFIGVGLVLLRANDLHASQQG